MRRPSAFGQRWFDQNKDYQVAPTVPFSAEIAETVPDSQTSQESGMEVEGKKGEIISSPDKQRPKMTDTAFWVACRGQLVRWFKTWVDKEIADGAVLLFCFAWQTPSGKGIARLSQRRSRS